MGWSGKAHLLIGSSLFQMQNFHQKDRLQVSLGFFCGTVGCLPELNFEDPGVLSPEFFSDNIHPKVRMTFGCAPTSSGLPRRQYEWYLMIKLINLHLLTFGMKRVND